MSSAKDLRTGLMAALKETEIPAGSLHAAQSAMESFVTTASRCSDSRVKMTVIQIGMSLLQQRLEEKSAELPALMKILMGDSLVAETLDIRISPDGVS